MCQRLGTHHPKKPLPTIGDGEHSQWLAICLGGSRPSVHFSPPSCNRNFRPWILLAWGLRARFSEAALGKLAAARPSWLDYFVAFPSWREERLSEAGRPQPCQLGTGVFPLFSF